MLEVGGPKRGPTPRPGLVWVGTVSRPAQASFLGWFLSGPATRREAQVRTCQTPP